MNYYPKPIPGEGPLNAPILLVGEAGGEVEYEKGRPFVGPSGDLLTSVLLRNGVNREQVRLDNLSHYRPNNNRFEFLIGTEVLQDSLLALRDYIQINRPIVIGALGAYPLEYLTGKKGIDKWRGSILPYLHDKTIKVIPTRHPSAVLRERSLYPIFDLDIKRIISDAAYRDFNYTERRFILNPKGLDLEEWTQKLCESNTLAVDIETVKNSTHILCVGFATSPTLAVCIVPDNQGRRAIQRVLSSDAKKVFQFGTFDTTQLKLNGYEINDPVGTELERIYYWDTLVAGHVQAPELPRSLEFFTSIYTREPYYKAQGRGSIPEDEKGWSESFDRQSLYEYNARDCCCTFEVFLRQRESILADPILLETFDFEMSMLEVAHHIGDSGMLVDVERRDFIQAALLSKWAKKQAILDALVGEDVNVRSTALKRILYDKSCLGLPTRRKHDGTITTDEDAVVSLIAFCKDKMESVKMDATKFEWRKKQLVCSTILEIRGIRQNLSTYIMGNRVGLDGRLHSTYKAAATETGRWAAQKYVDGSGINAQTMPREPIEIEDNFEPADWLLDQLEDEAIN
jgi:uracil-DNA glycosylase